MEASERGYSEGAQTPSFPSRVNKQVGRSGVTRNKRKDLIRGGKARELDGGSSSTDSQGIELAAVVTSVSRRIMGPGPVGGSVDHCG